MYGCTNPNAVNYNPSATAPDGSCIYLTKVDGVTYSFGDAPVSTRDRSFTLSYALEGENWVFFHDYIPDFYFHTREKLHNLKGGVWTHHEGPPGKYYENDLASFFVDVVFRSDEEMTLNSLNWVTEVLTGAINEEFTTLSHISVWNSWQHTGRISLAQVFESLEMKNVRRTQSEWNFNDFRDLVVSRGSQIVGDLFANFAVNAGAVSQGLPWYEKKLMEDKYFIVRLEFVNNAEKVVLLHDVDVDVTKSSR